MDAKKAAGIYYTPTLIVDYIVRRTIGKLLEGKTPRQVATLRILDPACGAGAFLLGAYQYLLDWHRQWYIANPSPRGTRRLVKIDGDWQLTAAEKRRILLNNIYGVDIDGAAVAAAQKALWAKVSEDDPRWRGGLTCELDRNIQCGNALVGPDFFEQQPTTCLDDEQRQRIHAFDWHTAFPSIMKAPGFDAVIGNPPYVSFGLRGVGTLSAAESAYLRNRFSHSAEYKISLYAVFTQLGIDLLAEGGQLGFIVPDSVLLGRYFAKLRQHILQTCAIAQIVLIRDKVFDQATLGSSVIIYLEKTASAAARRRNLVNAALCTGKTQFLEENWLALDSGQVEYHQAPRQRFRLFFSEREKAIVGRIEAGAKYQLSDLLQLSSGLIARAGQASIISPTRRSPGWLPGLLSGEEIARYAVRHAGGYIDFTREKLKSGFRDAIYNQPKLFCRQTGDRLIWAYDDTGLLCLNNLHVANPVAPDVNLYYLLGLLNSRLLNTYYQLTSLEANRALAQTDIDALNTLPIREIDFGNARDVACHDRLVRLVRRTLGWHRQLDAVKTSVERRRLTARIAAADRQMDRLVNVLYGVSDEELGGSKMKPANT